MELGEYGFFFCYQERQAAERDYASFCAIAQDASDRPCNFFLNLAEWSTSRTYPFVIAMILPEECEHDLSDWLSAHNIHYGDTIEGSPQVDNFYANTRALRPSMNFFRSAEVTARTQSLLADTPRQFIDHCLNLAFVQRHDGRSWRSDPRFKAILDLLDKHDFSAALLLVQEHLKTVRDYDGLYIWGEEALRGLHEHSRSAQLLFEGLEQAKDKRAITTQLALRCLDEHYCEGFLFWWCQTLLCFDSLRYWQDCGPCLYLAQAASVAGCQEEAEALWSIGRELSPQLLTESECDRIRRLIASREKRKLVQDVMHSLNQRVLPSLRASLNQDQ